MLSSGLVFVLEPRRNFSAFRLASRQDSAHTEGMQGEAEAMSGSATGTTRTLTVAAVARRLGVAPATLRTWARRYDLGPSRHTAGSHRRYTVEDFSRLVVMRRLTHEGVPPSEAARIAAQTPPDQLAGIGLAEVSVLNPADSRSGRGSGLPGADESLLPRDLARVLPLQDSRRVARGLARAALSMDARGVAELLRRQLAAAGVVATWDEVIVPVLEGIGARWEATGEGVEIEHQFAETIVAALGSITGRLETPRNSAQVLLSCAAEEQHSLPLYALAAALAERGIDARVLGARMPTEALAAAVRRTGPAVVLVYASMPVEPATLEQVLRRTRPTPHVLLGGPGWGEGSLPGFAERVDSLSRAVVWVAEAVSA